MNKESKMIRMILFGLSVTSFSIAAFVYIWQLYKTASSMPVFIMLSVFLIFPAMMISHQNSKIVEEKAKAQSEFLSNMSHEIRTPLNGLIGLNHMMMLNIDKVEQEQQKEQVKDWIQKSYGTANYLLSLVNDVLDVSKLQAGKVDLVMEPVMLETMLDAVWSMQHDNIVNRGVEFRIEKEISIPCIETDGTRIKQVLMNIIGNAAKFTPAGGRITLSVSQRRTDKTHVEMQYRCEDTGIGMSEEFVEKIFELFSQEQNPASQGVKGTGLGMPLSRLIVESMGGKIHVESKVGRGSIFTVVIPSAIAEAAPDYGNRMPQNGVWPETTKKPGSGKAIRILLAEDNELNSEILMEILTERGFQTAHAENGQEAVQTFKESAPGEFDIILMDMQMPVMDGCSASKEIRKLNRPDAKTIPIFACTANTFKEDRDRAMESGMNDFLSKPIDVNILLEKLAFISGRQDSYT